MGKSYHSETAKFAISLGRGKAKIARHSHLTTPCSCLAMEASVRTGGNPARMAKLAKLAIQCVLAIIDKLSSSIMPF